MIAGMVFMGHKENGGDDEAATGGEFKFKLTH